jgi:hypothetical protein
MMLSRLESSPLLVAMGLAAFVWFGVVAAYLLQAPITPLRDPRRFLPVALASAALIPPVLVLATSGDARAPATHWSASVSRGLNALLVAGVLLLFARAAIGSLRTRLQQPALFGTLLAYWLIGFVSSIGHGQRPGALSFYAIPVTVCAAATVFPLISDAAKVARLATGGICAGSLAWGVIAPTQSHYLPVRYLGALEHERLAGVLPQPNGLGYIAGTGIILALLDGHPSRPRALLAIVAAPTLLLSESRGAWLATAFVLCVGAARGRLRHVRTGPAVWSPVGKATVLFGLAAAASLLFASHSGSFKTLDGRTKIWSYVLEQWHKSPLLGAGPGAWADAIASGAVPPSVGQAHNQLLETLFTVGILGVVLLIVVFLFWFRAAVMAAAKGQWLALYLLLYICIDAVVEAPFTLGSIGPTSWVLVTALTLLPYSVPVPVHRVGLVASRAS